LGVTKGTCSCTYQEQTVKIRKGKVYETLHCMRFNSVCNEKTSCKYAHGNMYINYQQEKRNCHE
jgi:hypothetical protein